MAVTLNINIYILIITPNIVDTANDLEIKVNVVFLQMFTSAMPSLFFPYSSLFA